MTCRFPMGNDMSFSGLVKRIWASWTMHRLPISVETTSFGSSSSPECLLRPDPDLRGWPTWNGHRSMSSRLGFAPNPIWNGSRALIRFKNKPTKIQKTKSLYGLNIQKNDPTYMQTISKNSQKLIKKFYASFLSSKNYQGWAKKTFFRDSIFKLI